MFQFSYFTPTHIVFGQNTVEQVGALLKEQHCKKALLHYGGGSVVRSGLFDRVKKNLENAGIAYTVLGGVVPNPHLSLVNEGIALCEREKVDFILAIGGGSVIDSAKAIGYGVANGGDVWDFYCKKRNAAACLPIGVVLTIAAAGSEMSDSSVITNDDGKIKRGYSSDCCRAKFAIMDPTLTMTLPPYQTACGCTDILMHTMERYFTNGDHMELTDSIAEGLMRTVIRQANILRDKPDDFDARAEVMWASSLSHNGLTGCGITAGDFASHALGHELSGVYDAAHGAALAAIWGSWARYVYKDCLDRFCRFAVNVMGVSQNSDPETTAIAGIEAAESFFRAIGMPTSIGELGIHPTDAELQELAHRCALSAGGCKGSAKKLYEDDMLQIYTMAK